MNDLYNQLNPYMSVIGFVVTILSIPLAIYLFQKSKSKKEIGIYKRSFRLLHENIKNVSKLSIIYDTKTINNLTVSEVYFWNNGKQTIQGNEIVKLASLQIYSSNGKILDIAISKIIEPSNNFTLIGTEDKEHNIQSLSFDYMEPNEGCIVTVYHTGNSVAVSGRIQGGKIKYKLQAPIKRKIHWSEESVNIPMAIIFLIVPVLGFKQTPGLLILLPFGLLLIGGWIYNKRKETPKIFTEDSNYQYSSMYHTGE